MLIAVSDRVVKPFFVKSMRGVGRIMRIPNKACQMRLFTDLLMVDMQKTIRSLQLKTAPYGLPRDYIDFLEIYGGMFLATETYNFRIYGTGPMVEEWYASIDSDEVIQEPEKYGFLALGALVYLKEPLIWQRVRFILDIAGTIKLHCVIGIKTREGGVSVPLETIIQNIHAHSERWKEVAGSFTEWLKLISDTQGGCGYI
jgi:hypothetical protein